jgi:flagellar biosynthesis/type III secretory pathway ATPase
MASTIPLNLERHRESVARMNTMKLNGKVSQVIGVVIESRGPAAHLGEVCEIHVKRNQPPILAEVVGFRENQVLLMPLGDMDEIALGSEVVARGTSLKVRVTASSAGCWTVLAGRSMASVRSMDPRTCWSAALRRPPCNGSGSRILLCSACARWMAC